MVTKERMKKEAIRRMELLGIHKTAVELFKKTGGLSCSGDYRIGSNPEFERLAGVLANERGLLPYHVIYSRLPYGDMLNVLFVSKWEDDWEIEERVITKGGCYCYVYNLSDSSLSEYGSIGIANIGGILVRTW